jgi:chromosome segregation ATPase
MPGNPEKVKEFSDTLHTKCGPMDVKPERWQEYLDVAKEGQLASAFDIGRLQNRISKLTEQQMDYQEEARKLTSDQNGYDQWKAKQQEAASLAYGNIIRDSVAKALAGDKKHLSKYAVQVTEGVKDPQKLRELADHNAKATKIEESFRDFLIRFNSSAEGAALATLDYIEANEGLKEAQEELKEANTQLKDIKAAFEKLKGTNGSEVEELKSRIKTLEAEIGTRRKVADIPMKPVSGPAKGGRDIAKLPKGQDGGLREAFKNWQTP